MLRQTLAVWSKFNMEPLGRSGTEAVVKASAKRMSKWVWFSLAEETALVTPINIP